MEVVVVVVVVVVDDCLGVGGVVGGVAEVFVLGGLVRVFLRQSKSM